MLNISNKIRTNLPLKVQNILRLVGRIADREGYPVFVVGGFVRDILLGEDNFDVDIVIEGDAIEFAKVLAHTVKGTLVKHRKFGTATVVMPDKFKIDVATARSEYYERPAALPTVEFGSLKEDLLRRDFTINAMAVRLNRYAFGELIDFFGGQKDLRTKTIKVLHDLSFVDDPTRIFRAVRFEQRYNFAIDRTTEDLIKGAVSLEMFEKVEKQRIREEIILILSEEKPLRAIKRMAALHELRFIHPKIKLTRDLVKLFTAIKETIKWFESNFPKKRSLDIWLMYFIALLDRLDYQDAEEVCNKFVFKKGDCKRILNFKKEGEKILRFLNRVDKPFPSQIYKLLHPLSYEVILLLRAKAETKRVKKRIGQFFTLWDGMRLKIRGTDLKKLGLKPGPEYGDVLEKALYAKVDGKLKTKRDELQFVSRLIHPAPTRRGGVRG